MDAQKSAALTAYWQDNPWPKADLKSLKRLEAMMEDLFEASLEDFQMMMEYIDDQSQRDKTD